jgi:hypothetical protein
MKRSFIVCRLTAHETLLVFKSRRMGGACNTHGPDEECVWTFVGKPDGRRPFGKPRRRYEGNIKMLLKMWLRIVISGGLL